LSAKNANPHALLIASSITSEVHVACKATLNYTCLFQLSVKQINE